jgi:uncharacterized lipoprotein NlpE involved in copper resistance
LSFQDRIEQVLAKEMKTMRKLRALLAVLTLATFVVGCEGEAPKKVPEQKADLGAQASPKSATDSPTSTPPAKDDTKTTK